VNVGIVGAEAAKFTPATAQAAKDIITTLLSNPEHVLVSGGCHLGGVDVWAEEHYRTLGRGNPIIHLPATHEWTTGYGPRNRCIAQDSDVVHVIVVATYPLAYKGMRFETCYHCARRHRENTQKLHVPHAKSGACWTAYEAEKLGKLAAWHIL
jgi:hypothetical protein